MLESTIRSATLGLGAAFLAAGCSSPSSDSLSDLDRATLFYILSNTPEVAIHQHFGSFENTVYVSPDGHSEGVYDSEGKLVQDGVNDGSHNYAHWNLEPFDHFSMDIEPYLKWGNSETDTTTIEQRIHAYMQDFETGVGISVKNWSRVDMRALADATEASKEPKMLVRLFGNPNGKRLLGIVRGETAAKTALPPDIRTYLLHALEDGYGVVDRRCEN